MSQALIDLLTLATALSLDLAEDNPKLSSAIEAVEALGDEGNMGLAEAKELKAIVAELSEGKTPTDKTPKENKPAVKKDRLNYVGIKQIGSLWYSKEDDYKKSFATADGCAKHFNG